MEPSRKETRRTVGVFAIASFLNDLGSDMVYPLWPLFVVQFLGAPVYVLGLLDGVGQAVVSVSKALSGYLSDRTGRRKPFVWAGYLLGSASRIGYAVASSWPALFPLRVLDRFGKIRGPPRDAMVSDVSRRRNRGRHFGVIRFMDNLGAVTGVLLSILLLGVLGFRTLFALAAIPSAAGALLILLAVREKRRPGKAFSGLSLANLSGDFGYFTLSSTVFALGCFSYSFVLLFASDAGFDARGVSLLYLTFTLLAAFSSLLFGRMSDRFGRKKSLFISYGLWAAACLVLVLCRNTYCIVLAVALYGAHLGSVVPVQKAMASELAPGGLLASALGGYQMAMGLAALPSSLAAGLLWEFVGPRAPFAAAVVFTLLSMLLLAKVREPGKKDISECAGARNG